MKPFEVSKALEPLVDTYPSVESIVVAVKSRDRDALYALARLWLSEGIPYCFKSQPGIYEALRLWMSRKLEVHAKEITIIGSGRQGFSLSPDENLGRPFGGHSDLDLVAISSSLFRQVEEAFQRWYADYCAGIVSPRNEKESKYWKENSKLVPSNLARGFVDPYKIPALNRYPEVQTIMDAMYVAYKKLEVTPGAPVIRKVTVRVYRDWDSFILQRAISLEGLLGVTLKNKS